MKLHRAVMRRDKDDLQRALDEGSDVNEVDAVGCPPLYLAAWGNWLEGAIFLMDHGAKVNASNNAGDRPWHAAEWMGWDDMKKLLEERGALKEQGQVIVPDHIPKVKDFFSKDCWKHHPTPYQDFIDWKRKEDANIKKEKEKIIPF